ncbi:MAG: hypothetical protein JSS67_07250 [Bacteroidetes bacterium]|nr:hypothetical protein [Bacteroidota bacterium]
MQSVNLTHKRSIILFFSFAIFSISVSAQVNSPFSRYGLGDLVPLQSITTQGMGGLGAAYFNGQVINNNNPASYSALRLVTYDIGLTLDARSLRSANPVGKYNATNLEPAYLQLAIPLSATKDVAMVFGIRPKTKISYSLSETTPSNFEEGSADSIQNLFEGNGGLYDVFAGIGKRWKNFSVGLNAGYEFGKKEISTRVGILDTAFTFYKSNSETSTNYWGFYLNPGIAYLIPLGKRTDPVTKITSNYSLQIGGSGTLAHSLKANQKITRETFVYDGLSGAPIRIDSVSVTPNILGHIQIPVTYTAGFMINKVLSNAYVSINKWSFGADYTAGNWSDYRFYNTKDLTVNNWMIHAGGEFSPDPVNGTKVWSRAIYRLGFYTGNDYLDVDGNGSKISAVTFGAGFHLKKKNYINQFTMINTALELGRRGTKVNNLTQNYFKFSLSLSLSDIWFQKRKYD